MLTEEKPKTPDAFEDSSAAAATASAARPAEHLVQDAPDADLDKLSVLITESLQNARYARNKELVLVVGNTGAGKSTLVNYLMGSKLTKLVDDDDDDDDSGFVMLGVAKGQKEFAKIGHSRDSATLHPQVVLSDGTSAIPPNFAFCDCPGFGDNRKEEEKVCADLGVPLAISNAKAVRGLMIVIDYNDFRPNDRNKNFEKLLSILGGLLKKPDVFMSKQEKGKILFCFSKVPEKVKREGICKKVNKEAENNRENLKKADAEFRVHVENLARHLGLLAKLESAQNDVARTEIIHRIKEEAEKKAEAPKIKQLLLNFSSSEKSLAELVSRQSILNLLTDKESQANFTIFRGYTEDDKEKIIRHIHSLQDLAPIPKENFVLHGERKGEWSRLDKIAHRIAEDGKKLLDKQQSLTANHANFQRQHQRLVQQQTEQQRILKEVRSAPSGKKKIDVNIEKLKEMEAIQNENSQNQIKELEEECKQWEDELKKLDTAEPMRYMHRDLGPFAASQEIGLARAGVVGATAIGTYFGTNVAVGTACWGAMWSALAPLAAAGPAGAIAGLAIVLTTVTAASLTTATVVTAGAAKVLYKPITSIEYKDLPFLQAETKYSKQLHDKDDPLIASGKFEDIVSKSKEGFYSVKFLLDMVLTDDRKPPTIWVEMYIEKRIHPDVKPQIESLKQKIESNKRAIHILKATTNSDPATFEKELAALSENTSSNALNEQAFEKLLLARIAIHQEKIDSLAKEIAAADSKNTETVQELTGQCKRYVILGHLNKAINLSHHKTVIDFIERCATPEVQALLPDLKLQPSETEEDLPLALSPYHATHAAAESGDWRSLDEAAHQSDPMAQIAEGISYEKGDGGKEISIFRALHWYQKAFDNPIPLATESHKEKAKQHIHALIQKRFPKQYFDLLQFAGFLHIHFATFFGEPGDIEKLLTSFIATIHNTVEITGDMPLHIAVQNNRLENIDVLTDERAIEHRNRNGHTPIMLAVIHERVEILDRLLQKKSVSESKLLNVCEAGNLFHLASIHGKQQSLHALLHILESAGCTKEEILMLLEQSDAHGLKPLALAQIAGNFEMVKVLLEYGVDPETAQTPAKPNLKNYLSTDYKISPETVSRIKNILEVWETKKQEKLKRLSEIASDLIDQPTLSAALKAQQEQNPDSQELKKNGESILATLKIDLVGVLMKNKFYSQSAQSMTVEGKSNFRKALVSFLQSLPRKVFKGEDKLLESNRQIRIEACMKFANRCFSASGNDFSLYPKEKKTVPSPASGSSARSPLTQTHATLFEKTPSPAAPEEVKFSVPLNLERRELFVYRFTEVFTELVNACESIHKKLVDRKLTQSEFTAKKGQEIAENFPIKFEFGIPMLIGPVPFKLDVNTNKLIAGGFAFWGYACKVRDEKRIARLAGFFKSGQKDKFDAITNAAHAICERYTSQLMQIKYVDDRGVGRLAEFAAFLAINYVVGEEGCCVVEKPGWLENIPQWIKEFMYTAPPALVTKYQGKAAAIYSGVVFGNVKADGTASGKVELMNSEEWDLHNIFSNPRIRDEDGKLHTTNQIERDSKERGIDFGECCGTKAEAKERGYRLMEPKELASYEQRKSVGKTRSYSP